MKINLETYLGNYFVLCIICEVYYCNSIKVHYNFSVWIYILYYFVLAFGVKKEDLVKDILGLHSSECLIRSRLSKALMKDIKPLRPWMVRCPNEIFQR